MGHVGFRWVTNEACRGLQWISDQACRSPMKQVEVFDGSSIRHVGHRGVSDQACRFPMGPRLGMSVSDKACRCLRYVSDQACRSPMKHIEVSDGSLIRHVVLRCVSERSLMGLR